MATTGKRVIKLLGDPVWNEDDVALETITPGQIVALDALGVGLMKNDATAANAPLAVAMEQDHMGKDIDDTYASGDKVVVGVFRPGDRFLGWLASGQSVARGDFLTTAADGCLTETSVSATARCARAQEAVNASAGAARIIAE